MKSWHMTCVVNNYYPSFIFNCRLFRRTSRLKTGSTSAILWVLFGPYTTIETTVKLKSLFLYSKPLSFCFILAVRKWAKTYAACKKPNPTQPRWSKHEVTNKFWNDFRFIIFSLWSSRGCSTKLQKLKDVKEYFNNLQFIPVHFRIKASEVKQSSFWWRNIKMFERPVL